MAVEPNIINNEKNMHFEIHEGNVIAFLEYRFQDNTIVFMHTEVPESMGGKGIASSLAQYAFRFAKKNAHPVKVYCPFVLTYMKRHPEVMEQLEKES
ncbi:MAG: GNAT family N-acetyltransferase [Ginsengibacter sp.]